jgi:tRNA(His) 5'-end guanylyltransferase
MLLVFLKIDSPYDESWLNLMSRRLAVDLVEALGRKVEDILLGYHAQLV